MSRKSLLRPFYVILQGKAHAFDSFLGQGGHNIAFQSQDKAFVAKFQHERIKSKSDDPTRQARIFEEHYDDNLGVQVIEYIGADVTTFDGNNNEVVARSGDKMIFMRYCPHILPTDDEIAEMVLDDVVIYHRIVMDAFIPGNAIKLTKAVGNLPVGSKVFIDVGAAYKYGRDKRLPHLFSQDSLDELVPDGSGMRVKYRGYYNDMLMHKDFVNMNPKTQAVIKSIIFLEELFPKFHNQLWQLKNYPEWISVLSQAYHLFPYKSGLPNVLLEAAELNRDFIDKLRSVNVERMSYFKNDLKQLNIPIFFDSLKTLGQISEIAYFHDQLTKYNCCSMLDEALKAAYIDAKGDLKKSRVGEIKDFEQVFIGFDSFGLLTADNIVTVMRNMSNIVCCMDLAGRFYIDWNKVVAEIVLQKSFQFYKLSHILKHYGALNQKNLSQCVSSSESFDLIFQTLHMLDVRKISSPLYFQKTLENPLLAFTVARELEIANMFSPFYVEKIYKSPQPFLLTVQILKPFGLGNRFHLGGIAEYADFVDCVEQLGRLGVSEKKNIERLLVARDIKKITALIFLQSVLSEGRHYFSDSVKVFACENILKQSQEIGVDVRHLLIKAMSVLSVGGGNTLVLPMFKSRFNVNHLGGAKDYLDRALGLLGVGEAEWQNATGLQDYECYQKKMHAVSKSLTLK